MQVLQLLKDKPQDGVITIKPGATVAEAATLLSEHKIGGVVVSEDGAVAVGILSERDIVRRLARDGAVCLAETVDQLMTRDLMTCTRDEDTDMILARMTRGRFRHMPVVEDGVLIGIISIGDVVKAQISELAMEKEALQGMIMGY